MKHTPKSVCILLATLGVLALLPAMDRAEAQNQFQQGQAIFRFDTFGSEKFWGDALQLHAALSGVTPTQALELGLKVDSSALSPAMISQIQAGSVNLNDPAVTMQLLKLNAVVGVKGFFDNAGALTSVGFTCALCHTQVDNSIASGIGRRLDLWANRDLNVGAIIAQAPNLQPIVDLLSAAVPGITVVEVKAVLNSWGPGKFDAEFLLDGKMARPDGKPAAVLIPPAFGLAGVNLHTWTGWGAVTHWNAFVANIALHGQGTFFDPRLNNPDQFPVAAANNLGNTRNNPDLVTSKLGPLHDYQLSVAPPAPPVGSFNVAAASRGKALFQGKAGCAECHTPPLYTEPGWNMHPAADLGIDDFQANRAPDRAYRTSPLRGLWTHTKGGFFHDGRFPTLNAVLAALNRSLALGLTPAEQADLVQFLLSI